MSDECNGKELGYNFLSTSFTGTHNSALSGLPGVFDMMTEDNGTASTLSDRESNKPTGDDI